MVLKPLYQFHASSTHEFVQRAISKVKLGHPKPLWYDTIVKYYPPLPPFISSLKKQPQYPKSGTEIDSDEPRPAYSIRKKKSLLSKEAKQLLNWKHLFPKKWDDQPLPMINCSEDVARDELLSSYPFESIRCAIDPCTSTNPIQAALDVIKNEKNHVSSFEKSISDIVPFLLEDKLARELTIVTDSSVPDIEANSKAFFELELKGGPSPTKKSVRRKAIKEKIVI